MREPIDEIRKKDLLFVQLVVRKHGGDMVNNRKIVPVGVESNFARGSS